MNIITRSIFESSSQVYSFIGSYGDCYARNKTIARALGLTEREVYDAIGFLHARRLIKFNYIKGFRHMCVVNKRG